MAFVKFLNYPFKLTDPKDALDLISQLRQTPVDTLQETLKEALLAACKIGNKFLVLNLLTFDVNINCEDDMGNTPLMICAMHGFCDIARLLLHKRANVRCINKNGDSPLILAITLSGSTDMISLLLAQKDIDIYHKNSKGMTCLMKAVDFENLSVTRLILKALKYQDSEKIVCEAQNFADKKGVRAFNYFKQEVFENLPALAAAASQSDLDSVKLLISSGFFKKSTERREFENIIFEILKFYKRRETDITDTDLRIIKEIISVVQNNSSESYIYLKNTLLCEAMHVGNCELLDLLCQFVNQNVTVRNISFFSQAAEIAFKECRMDLMNILMKHNNQFWPACTQKLKLLDGVKDKGANDFILLFHVLEKEHSYFPYGYKYY